MPKITTYNPQLKSLLDNKEADWGTPEENQKGMILYGIEPLDKALYGMNGKDGELIVVKGQQKRRKTTFVMNVIANLYLAPIPENKPVTVIDMLESGMGPERWRDQFLSLVASKILINKYKHLPNSICPVCGGKCRELKLNPEFLRYQGRTKLQRDVIEEADAIMTPWPILVFGPNPKQGNTRDLHESVLGTKVPGDSWHVRYGQEHGLEEKDLKTMSRWDFLIDQFGAKIFVVDHVQQYEFDNDYGDYEKQLKAVGAISTKVAQAHTISFLISQVSLTSVRDARQRQGRITEAGGTKASAEANVIFSTQYSQTEPGSMWVVLDESRRAASFSVRTGLEETSGAFYGQTEVKYERVFLSD